MALINRKTNKADQELHKPSELDQELGRWRWAAEGVGRWVTAAGRRAAESWTMVVVRGFTVRGLGRGGSALAGERRRLGSNF